MLMKTLTSLSMSAAQVTSLHKGRFKFLYYLSVRWKYANGVTQNTRTHYIHKLVYRVKRFNKSPNQRRNWTDCQVKPKLISYMLMKSLTFFSLGAARASQVYTKTVNSGLFTALLALCTTTIQFFIHTIQDIYKSVHSRKIK